MKQIICLALTVLWMTTSAQTTLYDSTLILENNTSQKEIALKISKSTDLLAISFDGRVSNGSIEIELIDPNGQRQGGFQLNTSSNDYVIARHSRHGDKRKSRSTRSSIRSSGSNSTAETTSNSNSDGQSTKSSSSTTISSSGENSNSNSNTNTSSGSSSGTATTTTVTTASGEGQTISITSGTGETMEISSADGTSEVRSSTDRSANNEAKGVMSESIENPAIGTWKIILYTEEATGSLKIEAEQH